MPLSCVPVSESGTRVSVELSIWLLFLSGRKPPSLRPLLTWPLVAVSGAGAGAVLGAASGHSVSELVAESSQESASPRLYSGHTSGVDSLDPF